MNLYCLYALKKLTTSLNNVTFVISFVTKNDFANDIIEYFSLFKKQINYEKIIYVSFFGFGIHNFTSSE